MKSFRLLAAVLLLAPAVSRAQALAPAQQAQAYEFLGQYFSARYTSAGSDYRLAAAVLPAAEAAAGRYDVASMLSARYLTANQFLTTVRVDSLLSEADFTAMRAQLAAWRRVRRWRVARLRAQGIRVLPKGHRPAALFPAFTTYRVFPPLFSLTNNYALFYVENYCGLDCAGGQLNLLRRRPDGSWQFVLGVPTFVS